jgi:hypothetical protein
VTIVKGRSFHGWRRTLIQEEPVANSQEQLVEETTL